MIVGSLFSGIGGFDYGLERAGMRVVWQCEQDEFCRRVLARHWPGVPCHPDVRALVGDPDGSPSDAHAAPGASRDPASEPGERGVSVPVPYVDVLCGGFPCQDISLAGRGAGIDGERSGLWAEYARLIRELRPRYVVVENVSALLARGLGRVLGDLAACGYDAEWDCIPAAAFGAPHRRDRVWLVAYPGGSRRREDTGSAFGDESSDEGWRSEDDHVSDGDGQSRRTGSVADTDRLGRRADARQGRDQARLASGRDEPSFALADSQREGEPQQEGRESVERGRTAHGGEPGDVADADQRSRPGWPQPEGSSQGDVPDTDERAVQPWRVGGRVAQAGGSEWWAVEPPVGRVAHGVPDRLDQLASLGNALVPQIAEWLGRRIIEAESVA